MDKVIVWGAGREGRGFLADIFSDAGWEVVFAENNGVLCEQLRKRQQYTLWQCSSHEGIVPKVVTGYRVINPDQEENAGRLRDEIADARVLALCVYPTQYESVLKVLDIVIREVLGRHENKICDKDILLGVNETDAEKNFLRIARKLMHPESWNWFCRHIGVVPCIVRRTCTIPADEYLDRDSLSIMTNSYPELLIDKSKGKTAIHNVAGITFVTDVQRELTIKLYTYNMLHAIYAYAGARKGYQTLWEAHMDTEIRARAEASVKLSCQAISMEYGISENDMNEYKKKMWHYGVCRELGDTVERLAVDPIRKLSCKDRIMGPILLCKKHGLNPLPLYETLVDAVYYLDVERQKKKGNVNV